MGSLELPNSGIRAEGKNPLAPGPCEGLLCQKLLSTDQAGLYLETRASGPALLKSSRGTTLYSTQSTPQSQVTCGKRLC